MARKIEINIDISELKKKIAIISAISFISFLGVWVRLSTINTPTVLDYDPWWFYRYAQMIVDNNFKLPSWDIQSFYPPGRPTNRFVGWPYTIALIYEIGKRIIEGFTLMKAAIISPLIMIALIPIPAYLLGRLLSNEVAGLAISLFAVLSPTLIGVSMAGYCDTDAPVVFYFFLSMYSTILAIKKPKWYTIVFAIISNLLFVWNWGGGWITLIIFTIFLFTLPIYRAVEQIVVNRKLSVDFSPILAELKRIGKPLVIVIIVTNVFGQCLLNSNELFSFLGALAFTGISGSRLLVNISVAELQPINVFSREGFSTVTSRVGLLPTILTIFGLPIFVVFKLWKKEKARAEEIFLFLWALVMFYSITRGVRFSLQFSVATAISSGYVIGEILKVLSRRKLIEKAIIYGVISAFIFLFVSNSIQMGQLSTGMLISKNWYDLLNWLVENADKDALIMTWWDPGHILAGYSYWKGKPLKIHADGAHCGPAECIPYNHNIRIQDMGRIFSISNEEEAIRIIEKYANISKEACKRAYEKYDDKMPKDACKPATEVYIIASSDLIGKYYWLSYFGTGEGTNFLQLPLTSIDSSGNLVYGNGVITLVQKNNTFVPVLNLPTQGITNNVVEEINYFDNSGEHRIRFTQYKTFPGLVWVDPSYKYVVYMPSSVKNSVFTRMFFWNGEGLKHFKLVYSNPEIRVFKVIF